jgi:5-methylcytosine-specific restriction endonuclease McrA
MKYKGPSSFTQEQIQQIIALRQEGYHPKQIANHFNCGSHRIKTILINHDAYDTDGTEQSVYDHFNKTRHQLIQELVIEFFSTGCIRCKTKDIRVLQADHIDPTTKAFNIATVLSRPQGGPSPLRVALELSKCQPLCANCHQIKTFSNKPWWRHKFHKE